MCLKIAAQNPLIRDALPFIKETFLTSNNLVLVHLRETFLIVGSRVGEDSVRHPVRVRAGHVVPVLIITVALQTLHIEIASIKAIAESIYVVQKVPLIASWLVVNFDLVNQTPTFDLEVLIEASRDNTNMFYSACLFLELLVFFESRRQYLLSCTSFLLTVQLASLEIPRLDVSEIAFKIWVDAFVTLD